jgi:hypothetical protein
MSPDSWVNTREVSHIFFHCLPAVLIGDTVGYVPGALRSLNVILQKPCIARLLSHVTTSFHLHFICHVQIICHNVLSSA